MTNDDCLENGPAPEDEPELAEQTKKKKKKKKKKKNGKGL